MLAGLLILEKINNKKLLLKKQEKLTNIKKEKKLLTKGKVRGNSDNKK